MSRSTLPQTVMLILSAACVVGACDARGSAPSAPVADTLPSGVISFRYGQLPGPILDATVTLMVGTAAGSEEYAFGDLRDLDIDAQGNLYALDQQTAEVRVFDSQGRYLSTLARHGEGPGELSGPNGMSFDPAGVLWVNDTSARAIIGLSPTGTEVGRIQPLVSGSVSVWDGVIGSDGRIRQSWGYSGSERSVGNLHEMNRFVYLKSYDMKAETHDSLFIGETIERWFELRFSGGRANIGLPFSPEVLVTRSTLGHVWVARSDEYRVARLDEDGDTVSILDVQLPRPPVTEEDRAEFLSGLEPFLGQAPEARAELEALFPTYRPILEQLLTDDVGRLWVLRSPLTAESALFDVFEPSGEHVATVRFPQRLVLHVRPTVRDDVLYTVVQDQFEVQMIASARVSFP